MKWNYLLSAVLLSLLSFFLDTSSCFALRHFQSPVPTDRNLTTIYPRNTITVNGQGITGRDELAVYSVNGLCVCAAVIPDTLNLAITVWGDSEYSQEIDGIFIGQTLYYRYWIASSDIELRAVTVEYEQGNGIFSPGKIFILSNLVFEENPLSLLKPELILPEDKAISVNLPFNFIWTSSPEADHYVIQISSDSDFIIHPDLETGSPDTSITIESSLLEGNSGYFWRVIPAKGAYIGDWSDISSFMTSLTSVDNDENPMMIGISVSPNPSKDIFNINAASKTGINTRFILSDILGTEILSFENIKGGIYCRQLDLSGLANGIYFLRVISGTEAKINKIIKE